MNERAPLDPTVDSPPIGDDLDAGLAAVFGPDSGPPPHLNFPGFPGFFRSP